MKNVTGPTVDETVGETASAASTGVQAAVGTQATVNFSEDSSLDWPGGRKCPSGLQHGRLDFFPDLEGL